MISFENTGIELLDIHLVICKKYDLPTSVLFSYKRKMEIKEARQIFCYLSREMTKYSLDHIGNYVGKFRGRKLDHATVLHSHRTIKNLMQTERKLRAELNELAFELIHKKPCKNIVVENVELVDIAITNTIYKNEQKTPILR